MTQRFRSFRRHLGDEFTRERGVVGGERGARSRLLQRRGHRTLCVQPGEHGCAFGGRPLNQIPARQRFVRKFVGVAGGQASLESIADQHRVGHVRGARQEPVPTPALCEAREPLPAQRAGNGLTLVDPQKGVDHRVEVLVRGEGQIAAQPRSDQVVVDRIRLEDGRIRRFRRTQGCPGALHGGLEFGAGGGAGPNATPGGGDDEASTAAPRQTSSSQVRQKALCKLTASR